MHWRISLFGSLRAERDKRIITRFQTRQAGALLAYLAFHLDRTHPRTQLIELLWPGCEPAAGRDRLSAALSSLRRQLEPPGPLAGTVILATRSDVWLNPETVTTDVAQFHAALRSAARAKSPAEHVQYLAEAVEQFCGRLLDGCCESWVALELEGLCNAYFEALGQLLACLERSGDLDQALNYARHGVSVDPLREEAHLDLMRLYAAAGRPSAALRQYGALARLLKAEFGITPSSAARALAREISEQAAERAAHPIPFAPPRRASAVSRRLPFGTVTYFLADHPDAVPVGQQWQDMLYHLCHRRGGHRMEAVAASLVMAFPRAIDALAAAQAWQKAVADCPESVSPRPDRLPLTSYPRPPIPSGDHLTVDPRLRIALYTGDIRAGDPPDGSPAPAMGLCLLRAAHAGQILLSEATAALLRPELESDTELTDLGLYRLGSSVPPERLFQLSSAGAPQHFPPPAAPPAYDAFLPAPITRFFGREHEIGRLCELIWTEGSASPRSGDRGSSGPVDRRRTSRRTEAGGSPCSTDDWCPSPYGCRLVTLTGPGGTGKTRLALVVAQSLQTRHERRALSRCWFVSLLDLAEANLIPDKILATMRHPRSPQIAPLEQVVTALSRQFSLLLLDNFEHLATEGAPLVQALLERVPTLTCLVTSRQRLGLPGEQEFPVAPLPTPGSQALRRSGVQVIGDFETGNHPKRLNVEQLRSLSECPSIALFLDRAQAVRPDFQITQTNASALANLCSRLEGLPLAIELAAARIWMLTPAQILARIDQRFELLTSRQRVADWRHRSLRATLDWSYHLLSPELRRFFNQLSVFRGGWTAPAAEGVCAEPRARECLEQLLECSLAVAEMPFANHKPPGTKPEEPFSTDDACPEWSARQGEVRFRMLETLREYGDEQLPAEERTVLEEHHAWYYLALAEKSEPELWGPNEKECLDDLEREQENFRAALTWAMKNGQAEVGLRLAGALYGYWTVRSDLREARGRVAELLALPHAVGQTPVRAKALDCASGLNHRLGDYATARSLCEQSLAIGRERGDTERIAGSLCHLGDIAAAQGESVTARRCLEEGLLVWRAVGNKRGISIALQVLGEIVLSQNDVRAARLFLEESQALKRELGDKQGLSAVLNELGKAARYEGNYEEASGLHEQSLEIRRELGYRAGIAYCLAGLGDTALDQGDHEAAWALHAESLTLLEETGDKEDIAYALSALGLAVIHWGDFRTACSLCEESLALYRELGDRRGLARSLCRLGLVTQQQGDPEAARSLYRQSLALCREVGDRRGTAENLEGLAGAAQAQGQPEQAARFLAAAARLREVIGAPLPPMQLPRQTELLTALRAALSGALFAATWEAGQALSCEQAADEALGETGRP